MLVPESIKKAAKSLSDFLNSKQRIISPYTLVSGFYVHNSLHNPIAHHHVSGKRLSKTQVVCEKTAPEISHAFWDIPEQTGAIFSLLTSKISSDHVGDDSPWPDPLSSGCGCPAHSGRGACIHPRLIFTFLLLQAPHKCCVLLAVCKTEWQHCLNPL